jgi:pentatricopeptide repeat protein
MSIYIRHGRFKSAVDMANEMKERGLFLDEVVYKNLMRAMGNCRPWKDTVSLLSEAYNVLGDECLPVVGVAILNLRYCEHLVESSHIERIEEVFDWLSSHDLTPNMRVVDTMVGVLTEVGSPAEITRFLVLLESLNLSLSPVSRNMLLRFYGKAGLFIDMQTVLQKQLQGGSVDEYTCNTLLQIALQYRSAELMTQVLSLMQQNGIEHNSYTRALLVKAKTQMMETAGRRSHVKGNTAFRISGDVDSVDEDVEDAGANGYKAAVELVDNEPDETLSAPILTIALQAVPMSDMPTIMRLLRRGVQLDIIDEMMLASTALKFAQSGQHDKALKLIDQIHSKYGTIDTQTFSLAVNVTIEYATTLWHRCHTKYRKHSEKTRNSRLDSHRPSQRHANIEFERRSGMRASDMGIGIDVDEGLSDVRAKWKEEVEKLLYKYFDIAASHPQPEKLLTNLVCQKIMKHLCMDPLYLTTTAGSLHVKYMPTQTCKSEVLTTFFAEVAADATKVLTGDAEGDKKVVGIVSRYNAAIHSSGQQHVEGRRQGVHMESKYVQNQYEHQGEVGLFGDLASQSPYDGFGSAASGIEDFREKVHKCAELARNAYAVFNLYLADENRSKLLRPVHMNKVLRLLYMGNMTSEASELFDLLTTRSGPTVSDEESLSESLPAPHNPYVGVHGESIRMRHRRLYPSVFTIAEWVRLAREQGVGAAQLAADSVRLAINEGVDLPDGVINDAMSFVYSCGRTDLAREIYEDLYTVGRLQHWAERDDVDGACLDLHYFSRSMAFAAISCALKEVRQRQKDERVLQRTKHDRDPSSPMTVTIITGQNLRAHEGARVVSGPEAGSPQKVGVDARRVYGSQRRSGHSTSVDEAKDPLMQVLSNIDSDALEAPLSQRAGIAEISLSRKGAQMDPHTEWYSVTDKDGTYDYGNVAGESTKPDSFRISEEVQRILIEDFYPPIASSTVPGNPGRLYITLNDETD